MSALSIQVPFPVFQGRDGQPLENGYVWIGEPNLNPQTNPVVAYFDAALTIPAAQPLRTINGYVSRAGTPAQIYVDGVNFSILVQDSKGLIIYNFPNGTGIGAQAAGVGFTGFKGQVGFVQDLSDDDGSDWIGFDAAAATAVTRSAQEKMRDVVSVMDFGAVGDGVANDYQAFMDALTAAAGGTVFVPNPSVSYKIGTGKITVPANTQLVGAARHRTQLNHAYNGVMFELSDGAGLQNLWLVGDGANYTGRAITYTGTNGRQGVIGVRASDWEDEVQYFAVAAGSQSFTQDCRLSRRNAGTTTNRFAIVIDPAQQLGAVPRSFIGIQTDGTCSFDFGGCNNVYITNSFVGDLKYTGESRAVLINNTRIANQLALTIDGNNNTIVGCDIAPQITIASTTDNVALQGNSYNNLPVINNSGNGRNLIDTWYRPYTPTLTSGGTAPSLGDGTIVGGVCTSGATTTITGILTIGSTTSLGTGGLKISLPQQRQSGDVVVGGTVYANIGGVVYQGFMQIAGAVSVADMLRDVTGSITFNSPAVFAAGDFIRWSLTYPT
jgi:hypothetical protein